MAGTDFTPGTVLAGRFVLDDLLDENDGASFWRATDRTLVRSVAVHLLADSDERAQPLLTAARTSALVSDAHLLRVLDAAAGDGMVYVVNEWGSGVSLDRLLADGPLPDRRAAWVVREVAEAISNAHRNGVSHGRLLPQNVMVSEVGSVKLVGFAVDAVLHSGVDQPADGGQESDVRNLGALLYAALVGRWPGTSGATIHDAPTEHGRPLRPRRVRAGVPRPLDAICERVLNPQGHANVTPIESAHEVWAALSDYIGDPGAAAFGQHQPTVAATEAAADESTEESTGELSDTDTDDLPATDAMPAVGAGPDSSPDSSTDSSPEPEFDPEATQAASPMLLGIPSETRTGSRTGSRTGPQPEPPPERPLFADGPSAASRAGTSTRGSASDLFVDPVTGEWQGTAGGQSSGTVPPVWGPDADDPPPADPGWSDNGQDGVPGRSWQRLAVGLAVLLLVVVAVVFAFNLGRGADDSRVSGGPSSSPSPSTSESTKLAIASVTDFDPEGDPPDENPDMAPLAADGKPGTAWETLTYRGNPKLGGLKSGVGLLVDLGKPARVGSVRLKLIGSPTSLQILAAPGATTAPSSTDGLSEVASASAAGTDVDLKLDKPTTTRWLVVWLTSLPSTSGGFRGQVAEVSVRS